MNRNHRVSTLGLILLGLLLAAPALGYVRAGTLDPSDGDYLYQYTPLGAAQAFVKANWDERPPASGYFLRVGTTPGGAELFPEVYVGNVTTYTAGPPLAFDLVLANPASPTFYYVTVTPVFPEGLGDSEVSEGLLIAEAADFNPFDFSNMRDEPDGGYTLDFPPGSGWNVLHGNHYFERVLIGGGTVVRVQPFGAVDSVPSGVAPADARVTDPTDGWVAFYANTITVNGAIDARGRGFGGGAGGLGPYSAGTTAATGGSLGWSGDGGGPWGGFGLGAGGGGSVQSVDLSAYLGGHGGVHGGGGGGAWHSNYPTPTATAVPIAYAGNPGWDGSGSAYGHGGDTGNPAFPGSGGNGPAYTGGKRGGGGGGYGAGGGPGTSDLGGSFGQVTGAGGGGGTGGQDGQGLAGGRGCGPAGGYGGDGGGDPAENGYAGGYDYAVDDASGLNSDASSDATLRLGSGGGGGAGDYSDDDCGGGGGAGGGAIYLFAHLRASIYGSLLASGGAGAGYKEGLGYGGGGGGGGGGGILIAGRSVEIAFTSQVRSLGGANGNETAGETPTPIGGNGNCQTRNGGTVKIFYINNFINNLDPSQYGRQFVELFTTATPRPSPTPTRTPVASATVTPANTPTPLATVMGPIPALGGPGVALLLGALGALMAAGRWGRRRD